MQAFVHGMKVANGKEAMELIMARYVSINSNRFKPH